jgi:hypothetical protein
MLDFGETIRRCGIALLLLLSLCPLQKAHAVIGTLDSVPAATLLVPYFEVDLSNPGGKTTLIGMQNTSATAILTRATIWSNAGVPIYNFNMYLTGYDTLSFDMRDVMNGTLPRTASAGQDPGDTISHHGSRSQDVNFASCFGQLPYGPISASFVADMRSMLTGHVSTTEFPGQCVGLNAGDSIARGYLTIDTVNSCSNSVGFDINYVSNVTTTQNTLLGDYTLIDPSSSVVYSSNATAIEASGSDPLTTTAGLYTFYGRNVAWTAVDHREPLATNWMVQGDNGNGSAIVWRDPKVNPNAFSCGQGHPNYYPLGNEGGLTFMNRAGEPTVLPPAPTVINPFPPPLVYAPAASQIMPLDNATLGLPPEKMGFVALPLNTTVAAAGASPPSDPAASQSLVVMLFTNKNQPQLSSGVIAMPLDSATAPRHTSYAPGLN